VYAGSPGNRSGQSEAVVQLAVQPSMPAPQNPSPLGQSPAAAHGISIFTHTWRPLTGLHENPDGQSDGLEQSRVQCAAVPLP
jgi:hypothetical protein